MNSGFLTPTVKNWFSFSVVISLLLLTFVLTLAVEAYPKENKSSEVQSLRVPLSFLLALSHKLYPVPTK